MYFMNLVLYRTTLKTNVGKGLPVRLRMDRAAIKRGAGALLVSALELGTDRMWFWMGLSH